MYQRIEGVLWRQKLINILKTNYIFEFGPDKFLCARYYIGEEGS